MDIGTPLVQQSSPPSCYFHNGKYAGTPMSDGDSVRLIAAPNGIAADGTAHQSTNMQVSHQDFSVLGCFISFPVIDNWAISSINMNISEVQQLGEEWNSTTLLKFSADFLSTISISNK
ncbi:hypothetical protein BDR04DRAFT_1165274 [Suillus decipiens]|nr:hypothetical protein BDR04DRAFT_1165274 [Suillus decipiens]